ncbi:hypothetical protein DOY81_000062, partial [Sarcophaga bullata]
MFPKRFFGGNSTDETQGQYSMNNLTTTLRRYPKTLGSVGLLTTCGL